jgi:hypothetical protein
MNAFGWMLVLLLLVGVRFPPPVHALNGDQWLELTPQGKALYATGVIESWMHETNLVEILTQRAPDASTTLGNTFHTFIPCLKKKNPSPSQITEVVDKYLHTHPNQRQHSAAAIVWTAIYEYCQRSG